jgi:glycosyltransferase involved in cell wall biosynthesis
MIEAADEAGWSISVAAHLRLQPNLTFPTASARPWFSQSWTETNQAPLTRRALKLIERLPHAIQSPVTRLGFYVKRALGAALPKSLAMPSKSAFGTRLLEFVATEKLGPEDHVLIHTLSVVELNALIEALGGASFALPQFHIILRRDPDEPSVLRGPDGGIVASFERVRVTPAARSHMSFYSDTKPLAARYEELSSGIPVHVLPVPHCLPDSTPYRADRNPTSLTIGYVGNARREKGFQHLPFIVDDLLNTPPRRGVRFLLQSNFSIAGGEPGIADARKALLRHPRDVVRLIDKRLEPRDYRDLLGACDIVVFPYEPRLYRRRSSGILVQALALGCPVVVPEGTWLASQTSPDAMVTFKGPADLSRAARQAVDRYPALKEAALRDMPGIRAKCAAGRLLHLVLEPTSSDVPCAVQGQA